MTLQHLLSLVYHYKSITLRRVGRIGDAAEARVCSIELLRELRTRFPLKELFRFQCLNGMATFSEYLYHPEVTTRIASFLDRIGCQDPDGFVNCVFSECDAIQSESRNLAYISATHHFRQSTASILRRNSPARAREELEKAIAGATALAEQHMDSPAYIQPALLSLAVLVEESRAIKTTKQPSNLAPGAHHCLKSSCGLISISHGFSPSTWKLLAPG